MARYCSIPGCSVIVQYGRCERHQTQARTIETRFQPGNYGRPHRRRRDAFLEASYPWFCAIQGPNCITKGRMMEKADVEVDHIIPHRGDQALRDDPTNYQVTCKACHSTKTAAEVWRGVPGCAGVPPH